MDKSWIDEQNRFSSIYISGVESFLQFSRENAIFFDNKILCPCNDCRNTKTKSFLEVKRDLYLKGFYMYYKEWIYHGESNVNFSCSFSTCNPTSDPTQNDNLNFKNNVDNHIESIDELFEMIEEMRDAELPEQASKSNIENFERLLGDFRRELYPGCKKYSLLSFIVKLLHIKVRDKMIDKTINMNFELFKEVLPEDNLVPPSLYWARKLLSGIGLGYIKIEACKYDCALFWKENEQEEFCPICSEPRWKYNDGKGKQIPHKVLRCVKDGKISGLKSHDCHVFLQRLFRVGVRGYLRKDVIEALYELVHLPQEAKIAGPIHSRWMYPIERHCDVCKHLEELKRTNDRDIEKHHQEQFCNWFRDHINLFHHKHPEEVSEELWALANGLQAYLTKVVELTYLHGHKVVLFECEWFNTGSKKTMQMDKHFVSIDIRSRWYKDEPFVLPNQVKQAFYVNDTKLGNRENMKIVMMRMSLQMKRMKHSSNIVMIICTSLVMMRKMMNRKMPPKEAILHRLITRKSKSTNQEASHGNFSSSLILEMILLERVMKVLICYPQIILLDEKLLDIEFPQGFKKPRRFAKHLANGIGIVVRHSPKLDFVSQWGAIPEYQKLPVYAGLDLWFIIKGWTSDLLVKAYMEEMLQSSYTHWKGRLSACYTGMVAAGSKSYHTRVLEMENESYVDNFAVTQKKNGVFVNEKAESAHAEMQRLRNQAKESGASSISERKIVKQTLGKRSGYERGLGYGVVVENSSKRSAYETSQLESFKEKLSSTEEELRDAASRIKSQQKMIESQQAIIQGYVERCQKQDQEIAGLKESQNELKEMMLTLLQKQCNS
ncbi:hypothetical protein BUALT_Bualt18G0033300 [Buddleja alternifolia]|uniref:Transposase-associated domain-containing protein n=1 Tax=Buddleja alternifolia TaxID=168488 RepID=A0AAV6WCP7_9LAMI|nr:hypothetical protein BUALT_Bualt18G0033300 [Buddleja alternifolia]